MKKRILASVCTAGGLLAASAGGAHAQVAPPTSCGAPLSFPGGADACRDYVGSLWNPDSAGTDCSSIPGATPGTLQVGVTCDTSDIVGQCRVDVGTPDETALYFYGGDVPTLQNACTDFLQGSWTATLPAGRCDHFAFTAPGAPLVPACNEYTGSGWTAASGGADCSGLDTAVFTPDVACGPSPLGYCTLGGGTPDEYSVHYYQGDAATYQAGCEGFGGGVWTDAAPQGDSVMDEAVAALNSDANVTVAPNACDADCVDALLEVQGAITFTPTGAAPTSGFLYIPGGAVDPRAYAVAARQIAEAGFFVAIVPFPGRIAIADPFRPNAVLAAHPEIEHWGIGGHSLGGVTAALYADVDPLDKIEALAVYAGYPPPDSDLSDDDNLRVYSMYGTEDDTLDLPAFEDARSRLPANTYYGILEGANHAQFGYYSSEQSGDGEALITRAHQHELYTGATIHLLRHLGLPANASFELGIYSNLADTTQRFCRTAQRRISGMHKDDLLRSSIQVTQEITTTAFRGGHPSILAEGDKLIDVIGYAAQTANPDDITAPPIFNGELWCKMKSHEAITAELGIAPAREVESCGDVNRRILNRALDEVSWLTRLLYWFADVPVAFDADQPTMSGPEFLGANFSVAPAAEAGFSVTSPTLQTPMFVPAPFGGVTYCKLWSLDGAVQYVQSTAATVID